MFVLLRKSLMLYVWIIRFFHRNKKVEETRLSPLDFTFCEPIGKFNISMKDHTTLKTIEKNR